CSERAAPYPSVPIDGLSSSSASPRHQYTGTMQEGDPGSVLKGCRELPCDASDLYAAIPSTFLDEMHQAIEGLGVVALKCLNADIIEVVADALPGPALLNRETHDLSHARAQPIYGGAELGAGEGPRGAVGPDQRDYRFRLGARDRAQELSDQ